MRTFSKLVLKYNNNCYVEITNSSGVNKNGWLKIDEFLSWFLLVHKLNKNIIGELDSSNNLINVIEKDESIKYQFLYNPSVRDLLVYQKGKYVHKTIYLPNILVEIELDSFNEWNIRILAFTGDLNKNTKFFTLELPHFYNSGYLCLGNLNKYKKVNSIKEMDKILNYIFSTKFIHEWTDINNLFCTPAHL